MPFSKRSIGIFGAGQLARMISLRAREMGLQVNLFTKNKKDPAVAFCHFWYPGDLTDQSRLRKFIDDSDVITFESEFSRAHHFEKLTVKQRHKIFPQVFNLARLQDRWPQKELLIDFQIPTSPFVKINSKDDLDVAFRLFDNKVVFKKRFGGYDGFGTFIIKNAQQLNKFKNAVKGFESLYLAEKFIDFKSEKSLIFGRNTLGQIVNYPLMQSLQKNNQCFQVWGPHHHIKERLLIKKISKLLNTISYVGVIAFELFDMGGELMVNEVAPRVHNTGHVTQNAFSVDQFDLHLRCILGYPLEKISAINPHGHYLMQNLIGTTHRVPKISNQLEGQLYWYEKEENRPLRKMGHINYVGLQLNALFKSAQEDLRTIKI
jgi:5-(carboxyamino)imidazole ribonucleotide synthase